MPGKQITIKDIARALDISVSTVSRALKNNWDISEATRERVQTYAREHHYIPNAMASSLRRSHVQPNFTIGVIVPQFVHYYFSCILTGIEDEAQKHGYMLMVAQSDEKYEKEREIVRRFNEARICGLIVSQAKDTKNYDHFKQMIDNGIPIVFYDRICTGIVTNRIVVDDYDGAFHAVDYLIRTGCRRIAFYCSDKSLEISKNRMNGYRDALLTHKIAVDDELIRFCDNYEQSMELTPYMLMMQERPDAFFAINDDTAMGMLHTCQRYGYRIPDDISICGFTNSNITLACDPQLTTVEQRGYELGVAAARTLIERIENGTTEIKNSVVKTRLVVRGSTRPLPEHIVR